MLTSTLAAPYAAAGGGAIFSIDDGSGGIHLSDHRDTKFGKSTLIVGAPSFASALIAQSAIVATNGFQLQRSALARTVLLAAQTERLDPVLLDALIGVESGYSPRAVSRRGALGLMQLMPQTAKYYGVTDPFDPRQNIVAGARHLRTLLDRFDQNTSLALAAYNAGEAAVWRYGLRIPPFPETAAYVPKVLGRYAELQDQLTAH